MINLDFMAEGMIFLASDHRGVALKGALVAWLKDNGYESCDLGPMDGQRTNASDHAARLAVALREKQGSKGVLICGTGQAMAMTANRFAHIRAALCMNGFMARLARQHNDANVLVLGAELVGVGIAVDCLQTFLATDALGGIYAERCKILADMGGL